MKRNLLAIAAMFFCVAAQAKKVKLSVDFGTDSVSVEGVSIMGDFEHLLGYTDWQADSVKLTQEGTTSIYSTVLDLPAFTKFEYLFVNGPMDYNAETPPIESQVQLNFLINRFLYLDSLINDTTIIPAVRFSGNAPAGKKAIRFKVDMRDAMPNPKNVNVRYNLAGVGATQWELMCPLGNVYHKIVYVDSVASTLQYDFAKGKTLGSMEVKDATCNMPTIARSIATITHFETDTVCYTQCKKCTPLAIENANTASSNTFIYPNPSQGSAKLMTSTLAQKVEVYNIYGQKVLTTAVVNGYASISTFARNGVYIIAVSGKNFQQNIKYIQQ